MIERPIIFSGPSVRAILEDRKVMTRRILKAPQLPFPHLCPYGQAGDRLWVKESFYAYGYRTRLDPSKPNWTFIDAGHYRYRDALPDSLCRDLDTEGWHTRQSIYMPRRASRITLELLEVRAERLHSITEEDAIREGVERLGDGWRCYGNCPEHATGHNRRTSATASFMSLWDSINKKRGYGWDENPYVWVLEFRRVDATIEASRTR